MSLLRQEVAVHKRPKIYEYKLVPRALKGFVDSKDERLSFKQGERKFAGLKEKEVWSNYFINRLCKEYPRFVKIQSEPLRAVQMIKSLEKADEAIVLAVDKGEKILREFGESEYRIHFNIAKEEFYYCLGMLLSKGLKIKSAHILKIDENKIKYTIEVYNPIRDDSKVRNPLSMFIKRFKQVVS